jgi:predicted ester cyclase
MKSLADYLGLSWNQNSRYVEVPTNRVCMGETAMLRLFKGWAVAFPDITLTSKRVAPAGNRTTVEGVWEGTHRGVLHVADGRIPPTNLRASVSACVVIEHEGLVVTEVRHYFDLISLFDQLAAMAA